jgi:CheY-like chemotaxis protein
VKTVKHILVVDDEAPVRVLVLKILESAGYRVTAVGDGASALKAAREDPPDLVVCDVLLPGTDGFTVCSTFKRSTMFKAPVLAVSGHVSEENTQAALAAGADGFISKPIERERLLAEVAEWLARGEKRAAEST